MTVLSGSRPTLDELLLAAAADLNQFLTELKERSAHDDTTWRERMQDSASAFQERLHKLREQAASRGQRITDALEEMRAVLRTFEAAMAEDAGDAHLDWQEQLAQRLNVYVATLRAMQIVEEKGLKSDRTPKLLRSVFHVGMGLACFSLYQFVLDRSQALYTLGAFVAFFGSVEIIRRFSKPLNDFWTDKVFGAVARPQERYRTNSATFYMLGLVAITLIAPQPIACAAILILAFGDPMAAAIGYRWPIYRFPNTKSLGGSLAFWVSALLVVGGYFTVYSTESVGVQVVLAVTMVSAAMLAEFFGTWLDDNFSVPVIASIVGVAMLAVL